MLDGVAQGNAAHKQWTWRRLTARLGTDGAGEERLVGNTVAVWGLAYKPGTDTLRGSSALELCRWLSGAGAVVRTHDPGVKALPAGTPREVELFADPLEAATSADALVVCTACPEYLDVAATDMDEVRKADRAVLRPER